MKTTIEWATRTSNWLAGCTKVSPACTHCYAETMSARLATMPQAPQRYRDGVVEGRRWTGRVSYHKPALYLAFAGLITARHPRRVFINSMSDTFHADAPPESLADLASAIRTSSEAATRGGHVIMLLTKRPDRMAAWQIEHFPEGLPRWVWVGTTAEDQARANLRVPRLLEVEAVVRFLSVEPMLGPVDLDRHGRTFCWRCSDQMQIDDGVSGCPVCGTLLVEDFYAWSEELTWVIAGCESGPKRRATSEDWLRSLRDQSERAGVSFFLKQATVDGKVVGLPELDGKVWAEVPTWQG